jgi:hypothetical protein
MGIAQIQIVSTFIAKFGVKAALRYHGIIGLGIMIIGDILCKFEASVEAYPQLISIRLYL